MVTDMVGEPDGGIGEFKESGSRGVRETWKSGCSFCELASVTKQHESNALHNIKVERRGAYTAAELFLKQKYESCLRKLVSKREEEMEDLAEGPINPKMLNKMKPNDLKRILHESKRDDCGVRKKSRWMAQEEQQEEKESDDEDVSFPIGMKRLLRRCFKKTSGIGYCSLCNKLLRGEAAAQKHWEGNKHRERGEDLDLLLRSQAAILVGSAAPPPVASRGHYCQLCEADCSGQSQLDQHLRGERHRGLLRRMERELAGDPSLETDINPYNLPELWLREKSQCNLCGCAIPSLTIAKVHFSSKSHRIAAGLRLLSSQRDKSQDEPKDQELEYDERKGEEVFSCDICSFKASSKSELLGHQAGVRHQENVRTKVAVEAAGIEWKVHHPTPPDPPAHSVVDDPSWSHEEHWGHDFSNGYGGENGLGQPLPLMALPVPPPIIPTWIPSEEDGCVPDPIPWEAQTERSPSHPVHCAVCNTWLPTVTILKFYHRWAAGELENIRPDNWSVCEHLDHFFMQNSCTAPARIVLYCWTLQIQLLGLASRSCKVTITRKLPPVAEVFKMGGLVGW